MSALFSSIVELFVTGARGFKLLFIGLALLLAACDPGSKINQRNQERYQQLVDSKTMGTADGADEFLLLVSFARQTAENHANFSSGKESKKLLARMDADYLKLLETLRPTLVSEGKAADAAEAKLKSLGDGVVKELKRKPSRSYDAPYPFKAGDCVVATLEKEFSKDPSYLDLEIYKVEKIGNDKVLLKPIYNMYLEFGVPKQIAKEAESTENYKNLTEDYLKISCSRADEIVVKAAEYVDLFSKVNGRVRSLVGIAGELGRSFPEDLMRDDARGE